MNRRTLLKGIGAALCWPCLPALPEKPSGERAIKLLDYGPGDPCGLTEWHAGHWHTIEGGGSDTVTFRELHLAGRIWRESPDGTWERVR